MQLVQKVETASKWILYALVVIPMAMAAFLTAVPTGIAFTLVMLLGAFRR